MKKGILIGLAVMLLIASGLHSVAYVQAETQDTIYDGVHIDGIDVGGMTEKEAKKAFEDYVKQLNTAKVSFTAYGKSYDIRFSDAGLKFDGDDAVETAFAYGRTGNLLARYKEIQKLGKEPVDISIAKTIDEKKIAEQLERKTESINVEAENASLKREGGSFKIIEEEVGKEIDYDSTIKKMLDAMEEDWHGEDLKVEMDIKETEPEYKASDFEKVKDVLGTYSTKYTGTKDRELNLINGCSKIDGSIIFPGETFSVYEAASPFNKENGYHAANQYLNGEVVSGVGGGICQVSTTLYNAVLRAELEVVERAPHSMVVTYVPRSADAAIAGTYKDFKFKNDTDTPLYIEANVSGGMVHFTIYGEETRPSNRTIEFESKTLATNSPGEPIETVDKTKPAGYRRTTQAAHTGYKAELWKYVYVDGKLVESIKVNTSSYMASPARVTVGPEKDDKDKDKDKDKDNKDKDKDKDKDKNNKDKDKDKNKDKTTESTNDDSANDDSGDED